MEVNFKIFSVINSGVMFAANEKEALHTISLVFEAAYKTDHNTHQFRAGDIVQLNGRYYYRQADGWKEMKIVDYGSG